MSPPLPPPTSASFPQFPKLPAEIRGMIWDQALEADQKMQFVQLSHDDEMDELHLVDYNTEILHAPVASWPIFFSEEEMEPAAPGTSVQKLCQPERDHRPSNVESGLPAKVALHSAYQQAQVLHQTCRESSDAASWGAMSPEERKQTGGRGLPYPRPDSCSFQFRPESDVLCLVRRPGQKYHDFSVTRLGNGGPFAQLFPSFAGVQRVAFEWGPQSQFPYLCRDCRILRKMEAAFPSWRASRQAQGGTDAQAAHSQDGDLLDQFLEAVAASELPEVTGPYNSVRVVPADDDRRRWHRRAGEENVYSVSRHDFDADMRPVCSQYHGIRSARWFNSDLVRPLGLHHFPHLREMYMVDWNIRPRAGARIPADRQRFSGYKCEFVEVNPFFDRNCWDFAPRHDDGGDVFLFAEFVQNLWTGDMFHFVDQFRLRPDPDDQDVWDHMDEIMAASAVSTDPWRWRVDYGDARPWRWREDLSVDEIARLTELQERMRRFEPSVMVLACVHDGE